MGIDRVDLFTWVAVVAAALTFACGGENEGAAPAPQPTAKAPTPSPATSPSAAQPPADPAALADRGRSIYMSNCTACHNMTPSQDGALGPAVTGSSEALLYARVVDGTYPEGYEPKRATAVMVALPHLKNEIPALAAYLNQ
jgi:mono/diheme cytochrome c family protein